ncbi:ABC transporter permease [Niabella aquatica]
MFNNYIKTIFRNLWNNKGYSFLNIFGLAIGITCAGIIFLWVEDEVNYDQFNTKKDRLYQVMTNQKYEAHISTFRSTPTPLAPALQQDIPGIINTCRMADYNVKKLFTIGGKSLYASGGFVDPSLFNMFTLPFSEGNTKNAFSKLHSLVITEAAAKKFFGKETNITGKTVRMDNDQDYIISGVIKNIPAHSSLQFEWVAPFEVWYIKNQSWANSWGNNAVDTYIELAPEVSAKVIGKSFSNSIRTREPESNVTPILWSMNDWRLRGTFDNGRQTGGGKIEYVQMFSVIAWIILIIACINFMNLSTARSEKRAKEVGVRKVLGAGKLKLITQFIGEAIFMAFLSAILAIALMALALPVFNGVFQKTLSLGFNNPSHIFVLLIIIFICGVIAGSYPSFYLSSFSPVIVLKGRKSKNGSAVYLRKGLVITQFTISIILIISTAIIFQQIRYVKSRNLGFNKNNLVRIDMNDEMKQNYSGIQQSLLATGLIDHLGFSNYNTLYAGNNTGSLIWSEKSSNDKILLSMRGISPGFLNTYGIKKISGRDFVATDSIPSKNMNVIITASLEKMMGNNSALGKKLFWKGGADELTVVGVVNDYIYGDMYAKPDPVVFFFNNISDAANLYIRLKTDVDIENAVQTISSIIKRNNPSYPVTYHFVDEQFDQMFENETLISTLSKIFASLAILISCLGLFGLSAYTAEKRTKEIGIRKVLGASVTGIIALLSKNFIQLVALACLIAFPIAWLIMHNWLQNYQYRIAINWWIFLAAGISVILIALITVSFQSAKASLAKPMKSLRTE